MAAEPRSLDYGWAGGAVLQSAVQCMVAPDQLGGHFGSIQRRPWHGVVSWCVVGQRMLLCSPPQVVYVHAVARVRALRGAVGWVGFSGGSGGVRAAPAGIHWPVECLLGWVVVGLCVWQRCASLHITCTHGRARMAASEARAWPPAHPHLPCHTPVPLPPSHLACRLRVLVCGVGVARGVLWRRVAKDRSPGSEIQPIIYILYNSRVPSRVQILKRVPSASGRRPIHVDMRLGICMRNAATTADAL